MNFKAGGTYQSQDEHVEDIGIRLQTSERLARHDTAHLRASHRRITRLSAGYPFRSAFGF
jgi:hypothetical protein